jgi:hypothetical protein
MHWMSVKLPDNFQMREHSWPCRFHIIVERIQISYYLAWRGFMLQQSKNSFIHFEMPWEFVGKSTNYKVCVIHRPWMLAHLKIIWQFHAHSVHQKVSRFFGDDFFLGPNLVSFNRLTTVTRQTGEYKVDLTRHLQFPLVFGERSFPTL